MAEKFKKSELEAVAEDLNKLFEKPIPTRDETTIKQLKADLLEAAKELLPDDEITDDSKAVLAGLGAELPDNDNKAKLSEKPEKEEPKEMSKSDKAEKPAVKKAGNESKPGVIASILEFIKDSKEGITVLQIQEKLVARFADRKPEAMLKTVKAQVAGKKRPLRMEKEKKVTFEIQDGKYSVK